MTSPTGPKLSIAVRVDASASIGVGHAMRCLTLCRKLRDAGAQITFLCHSLIPFIAEAVTQEDNFRLVHLQDREAPLSTAYELLIIDHYSLDYRWAGEARKFAKKILVIDDLANRKHDCDWLLDQNYFPNQERYAQKVPPHCKILQGPQFALLRDEFLKLREQSLGKVGPLKKILCFMGGTDPVNESIKVIEAFLSLNDKKFELGVITSSGNPHLNELKSLQAKHHSIKLFTDVTEMAQKTSEYDLSVAAGGSAMWERLCLGIPTIGISISPDQTSVSENLFRDGYIKYLGKSSEITSKAIADAIQECISLEIRQKLKDKGQQLIDGKGVIRVISALDSSLNLFQSTSPSPTASI